MCRLFIEVQHLQVDERWQTRVFSDKNLNQNNISKYVGVFNSVIKIERVC